LVFDGPSGLDAEERIRQDGAISGAVCVHDTNVGHRRHVGLRRGMQPYVNDLGAVGRPTWSDVEARSRGKTLLAGAVRVDHVDRGAVEIALIDEALPVGRPRRIIFRIDARVAGELDRVDADTG